MKKVLTISLLLCSLLGATGSMGQSQYFNPIIPADYSDPDAIRVKDQYYMIASSFTQVPGLPLLQSRDLVNWELKGYALPRLVPEQHFRKVQHGGGVWAPSIRYRNNEFYIYYPDPDFGIWLVKASSFTGPWSAPQLVLEGKGLIDPCPFWDDNGKAYLIHAYAGSRAGIKSVLVIREMNKEGTQVTGEPVLIYDGHDIDPTIEGPKLYKRNGYYYVFAPAGGVSTGWQTVLRSRSVLGPYERKVVMEQGRTAINGPHQGAWVNTPQGEDWFLHFQDKEAYGRVVHLQPMQWVNDWPVIGTDPEDKGKGEPVLRYRKPQVAGKDSSFRLPASDEFNVPGRVGLQWQWPANPQPEWAFTTADGYLRMYAVKRADSILSYWDLPNILSQKLPAETFTLTLKVNFTARAEGERFGLILWGSDYAWVGLERTASGLKVLSNENKNADKGNRELEPVQEAAAGNTVYLRIRMNAGAVAQLGYSIDGIQFFPAGKAFQAKPGRWIGAKIGMFCTRNHTTNDAGYADIDWVRIAY